VNDNPPQFKQRKYEGFMTPDLTRLRNDVQVSQSGTISVENIALTLTLALSITIFYK
jgi:hypothetical protein